MLQHPAVSSGLDNWKKPLAFGIWSSLLVLLALIVWRKSIGAFENPVSTTGASLIAGIATSLSLAASFLYQSTGIDKLHRKSRLLAGIVTLVPPMLLGIALLPGHSATADTIFVAIFLVASIAMLFTPDVIHRMNFSITRGQSALDKLADIFPVKTIARLITINETKMAVVSENDLVEDELNEEPLPADTVDTKNLSQWMTRQLTEDGCDCIEGSAQLYFSAGQKVATLHIPFSPPFGTIPQITCEVLDESSIRQKVAAVHSFGARIEARRSEEIENDLVVDIGFHAVVAETSTEAA